MILGLSILLFSIAALLGIYLISFVLTNRNTPKAIAFIHGPVAAGGLILLIIYAALYKPAPIWSIILFTFAALGGFILIFKDLTGKKIPKSLALGHGTIAIISFILLLLFAYHQFNS